MGCCAGGGENATKCKEINWHLKRIGLEKADNFFESAEKTLKSVEEIRSGLEDNKEDMRDIARVYRLRDGGSLADAVNAWIWAVAAQNEGDITKAEIEISLSDPYVKSSLEWCNWPCREFQQALNDYISTIIKCPQLIQGLVPTLVELSQNGTEMLIQLREDLFESGMNPIQIPSAIMTAGKNISNIQNALTKLQSLGQAVRDCANDLQTLVQAMPQMIQQCITHGQTAAKKHYTIPSKCLRFLDKPMFSKEEIRAMKKSRHYKRKRQEQIKN